MKEIGRLYVKLAGRDAGQTCVIVDDLGKNMVLIDGMTRRRKCNIAHLEPLEKKISIKKGAKTEEIAKEFKKLGLEVKETKPKKAGERPKKQKEKKIVLDEKTVKKAEKKPAVKEEPKKKVEKPVEEKKAEKTEKKPAKKTDK